MVALEGSEREGGIVGVVSEEELAKGGHIGGEYNTLQGTGLDGRPIASLVGKLNGAPVA